MKMAKREASEDLLTLSDLCNLVVKEGQMNELQAIPLDTYRRIATSLARLRVNNSVGLEKEITDRLIHLVSLVGKMLLELRRNKIVNLNYQYVELFLRI